MCRLLILAACVLIASLACSGGGGDGDGDAPADLPLLFTAMGLDGRLEIFAADATTAEITNLTRHPDHDFYPVRSPDGSKIAFYSARDNEPAGLAFADLYVMDSDGSNPHLVAEIEQLASQHERVTSWDPDGSRLLYKALHGSELVIAHINGAVEHPPAGGFLPAWAPDGRIMYVARASEDSIALAVWAEDLDTLEREQLFIYLPSDHGSEVECEPRDTPQPSQEVETFFAPEALLFGNSYVRPVGIRAHAETGEVLYVRRVCFHGEIAVRSRDYAEERVLADSRSSKPDARWSPDGSQIAYVDWTPGEPPAVRVVDADGSGDTLIAEDAAQPRWSPDGTQIAFVGTMNPGAYTPDDVAIYVANTDGSDRQLLVEGMGTIGDVEWSPVQ